MHRQINLMGALTVVLALAVAAPGQAPSRGKPLELPPGGPTQALYRKAHLQFCLGELAAYDKHTVDPPPARDAAREFLRRSLSRYVGQLETADPLAADWAVLPQWGAKAVDEAGSADPLVLAHYIDALLDDGQTEKAGRLAEDLLDRFDKSSYPRGMRLVVLLRAHRVNERYGNSQSLQQTQELIYQAAPEWFAYAAGQPDFRRPAWGLYVQAAGEILPDPAKAALDAYGAQEQKDPWLWEMLQGKYHFDLAWQHRGGGGPAHKVPLEPWKNYVAEMRLAAEHYRLAYELNPALPEAATAMIEVAKQGHAEESPWDWFVRAIPAEIDHTPAYEAMLQSLRPRWGGSLREMFDFGEACVRTNRYDTEIPFVFVLAVHAAHVDTGSWPAVFQEPRLYDKLSYVMALLADHPSRSGTAGLSFAQADLLTQKLGFAVQADRFAEAIELWDRLGDRASAQWLRAFELSPAYDRSRLAALAEHGDKLLALRPLTEAARVDSSSAGQMLVAFQQILATNRDPRGELYLRTWIGVAQAEVDYHAGNWVDLTFDPDLSQWTGNLPSWHVEEEHSVTASNVASGDALSIYHRGQFPGPKELCGELELVRSLPSEMALGFYVGMTHPQGAEPPGGRFYGLDPRRNCVVQGAPHQPVSTSEAWQPHGRQLRVKVWGAQHAVMFLDGRRLLSVTNDPGLKLDSHVGIGTLWWARMAGEIRFKNLRLRKITDPPPPDPPDYQKRLEYFTQAIENEPDLPSHLLDRGVAYFQLKQFPLAVADLEKAAERMPEVPRIHLLLGEMYCRSARYQQGLAHLEQALSGGEPTQNEAQRTLAFFLATVPDAAFRNGARSLELATKAVAAEQDKDPGGWISLACAQGELQRFEDALSSLAEAQKLKPNPLQVNQIKSMRAAFQKNTPHRIPITIKLP